MSEQLDLKKTLNLPQTSFPMKAKLAQREPEIIEKWTRTNLYERIIKSRKGRPTYVLHDGPPYANGHIHLGTALNKILKDFIIKSRTMKGYLSLYVPGWDCHGLPIEIRVDQLLGEKKKELSVIEIREECRQYALKFIDIQKEEFIRLGVFGEWEKPYLTMNPGYEAEVLRFLAAFFESGNIYKGKRPVHWCLNCQTALAEAEIEYKEKTSPSIYIKFPLISDLTERIPQLQGKKISIIIWTTTPWTLPANLAIAVHPDYEYVAAESAGEVYIMARRLLPVIAEEFGWEQYKELAVFPGRDLEGLKARHPFIDRESVLVLADYVTLEDGTGCVHTAPGHGYEDYLTGIAYGLDVYTPVDEAGRFLAQVERYAGLNVFEANPRIIEDMEKDGTLLKKAEVSHSYPHCWRCKRPVIFRATEQWFISMDKNQLRQRVLEEIKKIRWIPYWGEERITNMMQSRPDWCISRQRSWGVPIPAFYCQTCGYILADGEITRRVADIFEEYGSRAWFEKSVSELLPPEQKCPQCGGSNFQKEHNILDVWFESGASHGILGKRPELPWPSDIYVEGHDQYRGWFNSSLVIGVGARNGSPYQTCLTHGFVLDEQGRAMSKSLGNVIEPTEIISQHGAEILRLWVAMLNYKEDARFGQEILQRLIEAYRKIRNTWRFLLGNLYDFNPDTDSIRPEGLHWLDRWILEKSRQVQQRVIKAYDDYEFHIVFHSLYNFFTVDLSSFYLDVIKDRMYCSGPCSTIRRSGQTAIFKVLETTIKLMAPILPFTADEVWENMPSFQGKEDSVHLGYFPEDNQLWLPSDFMKKVDRLLEVRELVQKEMEKARETRLIGNSLEACLMFKAPDELFDLLDEFREDLTTIFIASEVQVESAEGSNLSVTVTRAEGQKCQRCWNFSASVGQDPDNPEVCARCGQVLKDELHLR
ncbi:MAG: isoleucine--tRNA ligase [Acidobacteriota bacterium]|nr:isoleucine--tRNA ligase [Acidobacteriota bacterium]MDW3228550.1 isoleucine--tRNA ligase [Acidobacteriota bacterium]